MDIAKLGAEITMRGLEEVNTGLNKFVATAGQAEAASEGLEQASKDASASFKQEALAADQAATSVKNLSTASAGLGVSISGTSGIKRLSKDVDDLGKASAKLRPDEILNFSRQLSDIGVTAAMGMNPLMILIQQGPQIADIFGSAAQRGVGFGGALKGIASGLGLTNPLVLAGAAAVGLAAGAFALFTAETNKAANNKEFIKTLGLTDQELKKLKDTGVTAGDMFKGLWNIINEGNRVSKVFTQIKDVAISAFKFVLEAGKWTIAGIYGGWVGGIKAIIATVKNLPAIVGDLFITSANYAITGIEFMVNRSISAINGFIDLANRIPGVDLKRLDYANLGRINNPYAGAAGRQLADNIKMIADETVGAAKAMDDFAGAWQKAGIAASRARLTEQAKGIKDARSAANDNGNARGGAANDNALRRGVIGDDIKTMTADEIALNNVLTGRTKIITDMNAELIKTPGIIDPVKQRFDDISKQVSYLGQDIAYAFGDAIAKGQNFGDSLKRIFQDLLAQWIAMKAMGFLGVESDGSLKSGGLLDRGASAIGSIFGGFRANGGPVEPGKAYVVGEHRAEMFIPNQRGYIAPRLPQMGGNATFAPQLTFNGVDMTRELASDINAAIERSQKKTLNKARRNLGGWNDSLAVQGM